MYVIYVNWDERDFFFCNNIRLVRSYGEWKVVINILFISFNFFLWDWVSSFDLERLVVSLVVN